MTYVTSKVQAWYNEVKHLVEVADIFPHAAYAALLMGDLVAGINLCVLSQTLQIYGSAWRMLFINLLFQHYSVILHVHLLRDLHTLPVCLGGLGLINSCSAASSSFHDSEKLTASFVALIAAQCMTQTDDCNHVRHLK